MSWERVLSFDPLQVQRYGVDACTPSFPRLGIGTTIELLELAKDAAVHDQDFETAASIRDLISSTEENKRDTDGFRFTKIK